MAELVAVASIGSKIGLGVKVATIATAKWTLIAASVGVGIYAVIKCGKIIYKWQDMPSNDEKWWQNLGTAAGRELDETVDSIADLLSRLQRSEQENHELRAQLDAHRMAFADARNEADILRVQLEAERLARNELRDRLDTVENDNRALNAELADVRENVNFLMRAQPRLPVQECNQ